MSLQTSPQVLRAGRLKKILLPSDMSSNLWSTHFGERQPLRSKRHLTVKTSSSTQAKDKDKFRISF